MLETIHYWAVIILLATAIPTLFTVGVMQDYTKSWFRWWVYCWLILLFGNALGELGSVVYQGIVLMGVNRGG